MHQLMRHFTRPVIRTVTLWAEDSQRRACRNAMVASTSLAAHRRERDEVQQFVHQVLAHRELAHREPRAGAAPPALPAARLG